MNLLKSLALTAQVAQLIGIARSLDASLKSLARTEELKLKLALLQAGASMKELEESKYASEDEGQGEVLMQTREELVEMALLERGIRDRGGKLKVDDDPELQEFLRLHPDLADEVRKAAAQDKAEGRG